MLDDRGSPSVSSFIVSKSFVSLWSGHFKHWSTLVDRADHSGLLPSWQLWNFTWSHGCNITRYNLAGVLAAAERGCPAHPPPNPCSQLFLFSLRPLLIFIFAALAVVELICNQVSSQIELTRWLHLCWGKGGGSHRLSGLERRAGLPLAPAAWPCVRIKLPLNHGLWALCAADQEKVFHCA